MLATIEQLRNALATFQHRLVLVEEQIPALRNDHARIARLDSRMGVLQGAVDDHVSRLEQSVNNMRGQMTGGLRGARRDRGAEELGRTIIERLGPEQAAALVQELDHQNGGSSPVAGL